MSIRTMQLPEDLDLVKDLLLDSFQYPENPEWNLESDKVESIEELVQNYKRLWPLVRFLGLFSAQLRDSFRGFIWEADGQAVGMVTVHRTGSDQWIIGNVGVLPAHRRKGIARKLIVVGMDLFQQHGCERVYLQVIDGNVPAYHLYLGLGFEDYSGKIVLEHAGESRSSPELPGDYVESPMKRFDWQTRYEHERQITPAEVTKYSPVREKDFKVPFVRRVLAPCLDKAEGIEKVQFVYRLKADSQLAGRLSVDLRTRPGGVNSAFARLTPGYPELAAYMLAHILTLCHQHSPDRRIVLECPRWQAELLEAADQAGFSRRLEFRQMACLLTD
jgi:GNAT superfamily N-acetyltransferase